MTTTVAESWDDYAQDLPIDIGADVLVLINRAFFRGALAAATSGMTNEQLMAELIAHGRSVGTAAERARA